VQAWLGNWQLLTGKFVGQNVEFIGTISWQKMSLESGLSIHLRSCALTGFLHILESDSFGQSMKNCKVPF